MKIAISGGDPGGIGYEVTLRALARLAGAGHRHLTCTIHADHARLAWLAARLPDCSGLLMRRLRDADDQPGPLPEVGVCSPGPGRPDYPARSDPGNARVALLHLEAALAAAAAMRCDALVTGPVCKSALQAIGFPHSGHTPLLEERFATPTLLMMASERLRIAVATCHVPLEAVPRLLDAVRILESLRLIHRELPRLFGVERPHIAVTGLNPHAGEAGTLGSEEGALILPAIERARSEGIDCEGPLPADGLFARWDRSRADAVLAMYHDQGMIPAKILGPAVNVTLGLPIVRTSPDHGTAFDLAPLRRADPTSMEQAILVAARCAERARAQSRESPAR